MLARGDIGLRLLGVGLLDEFCNPEDTADAVERRPSSDIAITGFGALGGDPETDQTAAASRRGRAVNRRGKGCVILDDVVGGQQQHQRIGIALGERQGCDASGGRRVAADRLEQQRARRRPDLAQLLGDDEPVLFIGDQ